MVLTQTDPAGGTPAGSDSVEAVWEQVERLLQELEVLAKEVDDWWTNPTADNGPADLQTGARLHDEIEARLEALTAAQRHVIGASTPTPPCAYEESVGVHALPAGMDPVTALGRLGAPLTIGTGSATGERCRVLMLPRGGMVAPWVPWRRGDVLGWMGGGPASGPLWVIVTTWRTVLRARRRGSGMVPLAAHERGRPRRL